MGRITRVTVKMQVRLSRRMRVHMHVPATAHVPPDHDSPEEDQQARHDELRGRPEPIGQSYTQRNDEQCDHADRRRVPQTPDEAKPGRAPEPRGRPGRQRGNGGEVVWLERVPHAEQSTNRDNRGQRR